MPNSPYIVGFGVACIDYIVVAPPVEPGEHTHVREFIVQGGGLTGTALVAAARLGAHTKILGRIGDDDIGDQIVEGLNAEGVDTSDLIRVPRGESLLSVVLVDPQTAERTIYCKPDRNIECSTDLINLDSIEKADVVLLDAHWADGARIVARRAKEVGVPIVCDISPNSQTLDIVAMCDYPVVARKAAIAFAGTEDYRLALDRLLSLGAKAAVITCGSDGAYYASNSTWGHVPAFEVEAGRIFEVRSWHIHSTWGHVPAFEVEAVDTTGAGDVFHGAFAFGIAKGWDIKDTVRFASAVAAIKCTKLGGRTGIPTFEETQAFIAARS